MHHIQYYDRQGVIRLNDVSIKADLPRFLDLLLSFQRFTLGDWAKVPCLSPRELLYLDAKQYLEMDAHEGVCHLAHETNCSLEYVGKISVGVSVLATLTVLYVHISFPSRTYHYSIRSCQLTLSVDTYGKCK